MDVIKGKIKVYNCYFEEIDVKEDRPLDGKFFVCKSPENIDIGNIGGGAWMVANFVHPDPSDKNNFNDEIWECDDLGHFHDREDARKIAEAYEEARVW